MQLFFFFNDTATTEIYTLSLHDALPISCLAPHGARCVALTTPRRERSHEIAGTFLGCQDPTGSVPISLLTAVGRNGTTDRKSTRLNSSHANISYAVFCLKKKK